MRLVSLALIASACDSLSAPPADINAHAHGDGSPSPNERADRLIGDAILELLKYRQVPQDGAETKRRGDIFDPKIRGLFALMCGEEVSSGGRTMRVRDARVEVLFPLEHVMSATLESTLVMCGGFLDKGMTHASPWVKQLNADAKREREREREPAPGQ